MNNEKDTHGWTPDKKISWGASLLIVVLTDYILLLLRSFGILELGAWSWDISTAIGGGLARLIDRLRPRYHAAGRFWKPIYKFLLEQMSPPFSS